MTTDQKMWNDLTEEQKAKAKACKTPEELMTLAKEEGIELTDEQLEGIAGGGRWNCTDDCSNDHSYSPY